MERHFWLVFLSVCLSVTFANTDIGCCKKTSERTSESSCSKCCPNYILKSGNCEACKPGFWNENCSDVCSHPNYGKGCLSFCNCDPQVCHHITGCPREALNNTTKTSLEMKEDKLENIAQTINTKDQPISNVMNSSHIQIIFMVGGAALGFCIFTMVLLVIIIIRRQQNSRALDAELQMLRHQKANLERKTSPVEMNTYNSIRSVPSKSRSSDNTGSHCYQDVPDYMDVDKNHYAEKRGPERLEMSSCYQMMGASCSSDECYETPIFMLTLPH